MKTGAELFIDYYKKKYQNGDLTEEQINQMLTNKIITEDEKNSIIFNSSSVDVDYKEYYEITKKAILEG